MVVRTPYRVIYGDTDQMGVVYYANYLRLFEFGRNEHLRAVGLTYLEIEKRGLRLPVTEASCKYRQPARYDDLIFIETTITEIKGARVTFTYELKGENDKLLATGETVHANIDERGRPQRVPEDIVNILMDNIGGL